MKRLLRNLLDFLTLVSLLAAIGMSAVWATRLLPRQWQIPLSIHYRSGPRETFAMLAGSNYVYFDRIRWSQNPQIGPSTSNTAAVEGFKLRFGKPSFDYDSRKLAFNCFHGPVFGIGSGRIAVIGTTTKVAVGMGYFPLLFLLLPACRLPAVIRWSRERYARKPGQCISCGYDLRASTERCPECGTPIAAAGLS